LEVKDAAKGSLTPEEPNECRITRKGYLILVVWIITPRIQQRSKFYLQTKDATLVFENSAIWTFNNSREVEIESRVRFENLKLALRGLDFGFASEFMGEGSRALLEVWGTPLGLFSKSFEFMKKTELVQIWIQMRNYAVGGRAGALPSAPGESVFRQD
jgi:hypothetical protein